MMATLSEVAWAWWGWCAAVSWQVAVLFVLVAVLDRLLGRRAGPRMQAAIWVLVLVKLAIPPALVPPVGLPGPWQGPSFLEATAAAPREWQAVAAFFTWLAGATFLGAACLWRWHRLRREWLGGPPRPIPAWLAALAREAADRLALKRLPEIHIADCSRGPAVVGFVRLVVVLPAPLIETAAREEVLHVLLHELSHVKRRDPLLQLLGLAAQAIFWFHPSIWIARRRLSALQELCCDEMVGEALGGSTAPYRRTLLRLARPMFAPGPLGSLALFRRRSQLLLRVERLDREERRGRGRRRGHPMPRRALAGGLCFLLLVASTPPARQLAAAPEVSPALESLQGCLQLRYAVQAALARQASTQPPRL